VGFLAPNLAFLNKNFGTKNFFLQFSDSPELRKDSCPKCH